MKFICAVLIFLSQSIFAQNPDPRIRQVAPISGVRSVEITTVRYYAGSKAHDEQRLRSKLDTCYGYTVLRELKYYSREGKLDSSYYNHHVARYFYYGYLNDSSWTCISTYQYEKYDRTVVSGDSAWVYYYNPSFVSIRLWYAGDSMHYRSYNEKGKPEKFFNSDRCSSTADSFWDYQSCGYFTRKTIVHTDGRDTTSYFDKKNRWTVKVINHYDSAGHPVKTEYMNRSLSKFDLIPVHADPHVGDATLYLPKNGKQVSITARRIYNTEGHLLRESWTVADDPFATYERSYTYLFW